MTPEPDPALVEAGQWWTAVDPIAKKLEVGAKFGDSTVFNREGSEALAKLLREMARIIDDEVVRRSSATAIRTATGAPTND